jgi:hypothetical protein
MKVKQYNEMMAYLTRPGFNSGGSVNFNGGGSVKKKPVLPKRKPAAEIKRRQKINYEKIKQYLGEESQEFIERELGFAVGGGVNPAQLKQRFMQLVSSIQDADDAEIPSIVAQAKQIKNQIDDLNRQLAPDRQIRIAAEGLQFDNPLVDAARIQRAVKPVQGIKPVEAIKSITEDNPVLAAVPEFKRGDKGTLADEEEKLDPDRQVAVDPRGKIVQAGMIGRRTDKSYRDYLRRRELFRSIDPTITETEGSFAEGGRIGFTKGGSVALAKILNELPDGTEVTRDMVKKIIADNNIDVSVNNFFAKPSTTLKEGITLVKQKSRIKITPEILKEFDAYVKKTDLDIKSIGENFGYKKTKTTGLDTNSLLYKEYVKAYGEPEPGRFKKYRLMVDDPIVQARLDKVRELGSIKAAAKDLKIDRRALAKQVAKFDPELLEEIGAGQANIPNPEGKYDYSKVRAKYIKAMERTLLKMPGGQKTLNQTLALMDKIHAKNKIIAELTDEEILSNKKLMDAMRLDVTELKTSKPRLKFDRYKDLTDKELVEKIRELAETNQLFQVEHQIPINSQRTASLFPKNIQAAVGRVGGQIESMKKFVINNPDSPVVNDIDKFLKSQNVQIKGAAGQNIGYAKNIVFNSKTNTSEIVNRGLDIFQKSDGPVLGMNRFNPRLLDFRKLPQDIRNMKDVVRDLIKTPAGKRIARNVFKGLKFTGAGVAGEIAFAVPFALENYASGYDFDRSIGDLTFGAYGSTEEKDLRKSAGELGYATKTVTELEALMPEILNKLNTYDDVNDPRGEKRQQFENLYNSTVDRYMKAYNLFVTDRGKFDKELWGQGLNNLTAGINQNEKFRVAKEKERGIKEASKNITGFELDLGFAGGGLAKQAGDESGKPPESGPTPDGPSKGLAYLFKNGMKE